MEDTTVVQWVITINFLHCAEYTLIKGGHALRISLQVLLEQFSLLVSSVLLEFHI